jgi:hypothetical protein
LANSGAPRIVDQVLGRYGVDHDEFVCRLGKPGVCLRKVNDHVNLARKLAGVQRRRQIHLDLRFESTGSRFDPFAHDPVNLVTRGQAGRQMAADESS